MKSRRVNKATWLNKAITYTGTAAMVTFVLASLALVGMVPEVAAHPTDHTARLALVVLTSTIGAALGLALGCAFLTDDEEEESDGTYTDD